MKHVIKPACSLFLIAAITTALLSFVYRITLEPIENQHRLIRERTMRQILPQADSFRDLNVETDGDSSIIKIYEALRGGNVFGYILELDPVGYGGPINMMAGILREERRIAGVRILSHSETPGLGSSISRESFYRIFDRRSLVPLGVVRNNPGANDIQALTSATISSRAVTYAVNEAIDWFNTFDRDK